jgi:tRNA(Ile)-lysidine synthase
VAVAELAGDPRDIEASHIEAVRSLLNKPLGKRISLPRGFVCEGTYNELVFVKLPLAIEGKAAQTHLSPACPFPPLPGELSLKVPGETVLPGWKVVVSIVGEQVDEGRCQPLKGAWQSLEIGSSSSAPGNDRGECHPEPFAICHSERSEESHAAQGGLGEAMSAHFDFQKTGPELFVRQRRPGDQFQPLGMNAPKKLQDFMVDSKIPRSWRDRILITCSLQQIIWVVGWRIDDRVKTTEASKEILRLEFIKSQ